MKNFWKQAAYCDAIGFGFGFAVASLLDKGHAILAGITVLAELFVMPGLHTRWYNPGEKGKDQGQM